MTKGDITYHSVKSNLSMEIDKTRRINRVAEVVEAYKAGTSISSIEDTYDVSKGNIYHWLRDAGIKLTKREQVLKDADDLKKLVLNDYRRGDKLTDIATRHKIVISRVSQIAKDAGEPSRYGAITNTRRAKRGRTD